MTHCGTKKKRDRSLFISPGKGGGGEGKEDFRGSLSFRGNRGGVSRRTQSIKGGLQNIDSRLTTDQGRS